MNKRLGVKAIGVTISLLAMAILANSADARLVSPPPAEGTCEWVDYMVDKSAYATNVSESIADIVAINDAKNKHPELNCPIYHSTNSPGVIGQ